MDADTKWIMIFIGILGFAIQTLVLTVSGTWAIARIRIEIEKWVLENFIRRDAFFKMMDDVRRMGEIRDEKFGRLFEKLEMKLDTIITRELDGRD